MVHSCKMKGIAFNLFAFLCVLPIISRAKTFIVETSDKNTTPPPILKEQLSRGKKTPKKNRKIHFLRLCQWGFPCMDPKKRKNYPAVQIWE